MKKVITIGNGFIANHLPYQIVQDRLFPNQKSIIEFINKYQPDVIINTIGFCGVPNVDQCEIEKDKTYIANVIIPMLLATECKNYNIKMIHIGSGCVYFGESPYVYIQQKYDPFPGTIIDPGWRENNFANPKSFYSKTKYATDLILGEMDHVIILRIRMPISHKNTSRNLINKLRNYKQIINIPNSVTFMNDLVRCIDWFINNKFNQNGIFHVVNPQALTATQIMQEYQKYNKNHIFDIIDEYELDNLTIAKRSNCILDTNKLQNIGFKMTDSVEALINCMSIYVTNI